ncbi:protein of unknown function (plasmid) [Caballeronia sp. S22]
MEPVYGVSREVGIGKLKDSLCLSLETETNSFRTVTNLATNRPERHRTHGAGTKKSACSIAGAALESPSQNPRAVDEPERVAILAIDAIANALKRPLKTLRFEINSVSNDGKRRKMRFEGAPRRSARGGCGSWRWWPPSPGRRKGHPRMCLGWP